MRLDALRLAENLRERLVSEGLSSAYVRDKKLQELCREIWSGPASDGGLLSELWVEAALPHKSSGETLRALAQAGTFSSQMMAQLDRTGALPADRPLYTHQAEAIEKSRSGDTSRPALVVTAGTGAGKTEAFLLPLLNDLKSRPRDQGGVQAIILYPLNALVNDQVDRLYRWLQGQSELRLFHFTSETPEDRKAASLGDVPRFEACRARTRAQARGLEDEEGRGLSPSERRPVPDILITNYSMLEYMLCRPQDRVFFGPGLRALVLDEAHLYTGTLAAEITLLLRRLYDRCQVRPDQLLQIATSATIGSGAKGELGDFAARLFGKKPEQVHEISGQVADKVCDASGTVNPTPSDLLDFEPLSIPTVVQEKGGQERLHQSASDCARMAAPLSRIASGVDRHLAECEDTPARLLRGVLQQSPLAAKLEAILREHKYLALSDLSLQLWQRSDSEAVRATTVFLGLVASARDSLDQIPLIPHKLHLFSRGSEGLATCVDSACPENRRRWHLGPVWPGRPDCCPACQGLVLTLLTCKGCGQSMLGGCVEDGKLRPVFPRELPERLYVLDSLPDTQECTLLPARRKETGAGATGTRVYRLESEECPGCGKKLKDVREMQSRTGMVLSLLTEGLLAEVPPMVLPHSQSNEILPAQGRRLLAFSDSRAEAARLGPRLRRQHELQIIRAAVVDLMRQAPEQEVEILEMLRADIEDLSQKLKGAGLSEVVRNAREKELRQKQQQLAYFEMGQPVKDWQDQLGRHAYLHQLLDDDSAGSHKHDQWTQHKWEENFRRNKGRAALLMGKELANREFGTLERTGWAEVTYPGLGGLGPPPEFSSQIADPAHREAVKSWWPLLAAALLDNLRMNGCVTLGTETDDRSWAERGQLMGHWIGQAEFVGVREEQLRRRFVRALLEKLEVPDATRLAPLWLEALFQQWEQHAVQATSAGVRPEPEPGQLGWLENMTRHTKRGPELSLRIVFPHLGLRKPVQLFQCSKTGNIWPRSVLGSAPDNGSFGTLEPASPELLDRCPRFGRLRRELSGSPVFQLALWAEEHSAQLSPQETRRLQDLFRVGLRNLLSATTTLELGIDIGGLTATFLSNVPPGKANYLQRAGRVGRRADGSSIVVTYARNRPYDREVFRRIGDYFGRKLRKPMIFLERERVLRRHFHAWLLGRFFHELYRPDEHRGAMLAFGRMGIFCGKPLPRKWDGKGRKPELPEAEPALSANFALPAWWPKQAGPGLVQPFLSFLTWLRTLSSHPYRSSLETVFSDTPLDVGANWTNLLGEAEAHFRNVIGGWCGDYDELLAGWSGADQAGHANALSYQLDCMYETTVIESLANGRFLPRYSFPIGLQQLRVLAPDQKGRVREENQYSLERPGLLALREYVPGSQLLVGGKLLTSRGVLKHWSGANVDRAFGLRGYATECKKGHFIYSIDDKREVCPVCQYPAKGTFRELLFPRHGFTTAGWDPPSFASDASRVGTVERATIAFHARAQGSDLTDLEVDDFAGIRGMRARYREESNILVYNGGDNEVGFALCTKCGYAESEQKLGQGRENLRPSFLRHAPIHFKDERVQCWKDGEAPVLRNQVMAAHEPTDIVLLEFPSALDATDESLVNTLGIALQLAGARLLELDSRELGSMAIPVSETGFGAVVYDNVAGGAAHVLELLRLGRPWLEEARALLFVDEAHDQRCSIACLDCLLTFDVQGHVERGMLRRRAAREALDALLAAAPAAGTLVEAG